MFNTDPLSLSLSLCVNVLRVREFLQLISNGVTELALTVIMTPFSSRPYPTIIPPGPPTAAQQAVTEAFGHARGSAQAAVPSSPSPSLSPSESPVSEGETETASATELTSAPVPPAATAALDPVDDASRPFPFGGTVRNLELMRVAAAGLASLTVSQRAKTIVIRTPEALPTLCVRLEGCCEW